MQTLQIRLTQQQIDKTDELVKQGVYANRSEVARDAIRRLVFQKELETKEKHLVLFASDAHGNKQQYQKLFRKALSDQADTLIIGGDITPKDPQNRTVKKQKEFLETFFIPAITDFKRELHANKQECEVFIILGNDDFKPNHDVLKANQEAGYVLINNSSAQTTDGFTIVGYPYVPLTPYQHKDWEKLDANNTKETEYRTKYLTTGTIAQTRTKTFDINNRTDTIENDLNKLLENKDPKKTILVTHAPPYNTCLDVTKYEEHVGSYAIKQLIKEKQPLITLHGHIHETVDMTGQFKEQTNQTLSMSTGNYHDTKNMAVIRFDLYNPENAERIII